MFHFIICCYFVSFLVNLNKFLAYHLHFAYYYKQYANHSLETIEVYQCFSTFFLKGPKSRLTTLLENRTKEILTQVN